MTVERVLMTLPQAQVIVASVYFGWMFFFMVKPFTSKLNYKYSKTLPWGASQFLRGWVETTPQNRADAFNFLPEG